MSNAATPEALGVAGVELSGAVEPLSYHDTVPAAAAGVTVELSEMSVSAVPL
jgi:hypothetical protein